MCLLLLLLQQVLLLVMMCITMMPLHLAASAAVCCVDTSKRWICATRFSGKRAAEPSLSKGHAAIVMQDELRSVCLCVFDLIIVAYSTLVQLQMLLCVRQL
jgi:hypothetical protein